MKKVNSVLFVVAIFSILGFVFITLTKPASTNPNKFEVPINNQNLGSIKVGEAVFDMEIADTDEERIRGLSYRQELPLNTALLFKFEREERQGFWMKDMYFPIDIIWVDQNRRIVHIEREVSPDTFPKVFRPEEKALYVIEINSGLVNENKIKIGDLVNF